MIHNRITLKPLRKKLRSTLTPAEAKLWTVLQQKKLDGRKFRRQHSIGNFIVDFYCAEEKLVIELDGQVHNFTAPRDEVKEKFLGEMNIKVIRFENKHVFENLEGVLTMIRKAFQNSLLI